MLTEIMIAPERPKALTDRDVVRLAAAVLADPRAWANASTAQLDAAAVRKVRARALALLLEALDTV
jgi:hypothetical protein